MAICPKCGKEIEYLRDFSPGWTEYKFTVGAYGLGDYADADNVVPDDCREEEYECPECSMVLFRNEADAVAFLKGE